MKDLKVLELNDNYFTGDVPSYIYDLGGDSLIIQNNCFNAMETTRPFITTQRPAVDCDNFYEMLNETSTAMDGTPSASTNNVSRGSESLSFTGTKLILTASIAGLIFVIALIACISIFMIRRKSQHRRKYPPPQPRLEPPGFSLRYSLSPMNPRSGSLRDRIRRSSGGKDCPRFPDEKASVFGYQEMRVFDDGITKADPAAEPRVEVEAPLRLFPDSALKKRQEAMNGTLAWDSRGTQREKSGYRDEPAGIAGSSQSLRAPPLRSEASMTSLLLAEVAGWDALKVARWLESMHVGSGLVDILKDHNVTGYYLLVITDSALVQLGVSDPIGREVILNAVEKLRDGDPRAVASASERSALSGTQRDTLAAVSSGSALPSYFR
ncbi:hypothetical protein HDU97_002479 [Phlyctochytrium planicorne]|nr:hypothetical protein HDU97_002479 [Phlyctochytrium planicorne]